MPLKRLWNRQENNATKWKSLLSNEVANEHPEEEQLGKGKEIYKAKFGYNPKMEGYTKSSSDINELYEMAV